MGRARGVAAKKVPWDKPTKWFRSSPGLYARVMAPYIGVTAEKTDDGWSWALESRGTMNDLFSSPLSEGTELTLKEAKKAAEAAFKKRKGKKPWATSTTRSSKPTTRSQRRKR